MANNELSILIRAVDEMSGTLKKAEGNLQKFTSTTERQSKKTQDAFEGSTTALLALGNIASTVDNIFSSYTNIQLRLENATLRVTNSHERLADAQTKLNRLIRDGKANADEMADAQLGVERATRGVEISENNLARANNMVIGTYINIGVQTVTLLASLPKLIATIRSLEVATLALNAALAVITISVGLIVTILNQSKKAIEDVNTAIQILSDKGKTNIQLVIDTQRKLSDEVGRTRDAVKETYDIISGAVKNKSQAELDLTFKLKDKELDLAKTRLKGSDDDIAKKQEQVDAIRSQLDVMEAQRNAELAYVDTLRVKNQQILPEQQETEKLFQMPYKSQLNYLESSFTPALNKIRQEQLLADTEARDTALLMQETDNNKLDRLLKEREEKVRQHAKNIKAIIYSLTGRSSLFIIEELLGLNKSGSKKGNSVTTSNNNDTGTIYLNDFIMRPNGKIVKTNPNDTIIGTQNPDGIGNAKGVTYNFYIDKIQGIDSKDIMEAFQRELSKKISLG